MISNQNHEPLPDICPRYTARQRYPWTGDRPPCRLLYCAVRKGARSRAADLNFAHWLRCAIGACSLCNRRPGSVDMPVAQPLVRLLSMLFKLKDARAARAVHVAFSHVPRASGFAALVEADTIDQFVVTDSVDSASHLNPSSVHPKVGRPQSCAAPRAAARTYAKWRLCGAFARRVATYGFGIIPLDRAVKETHE
jgi:hypothetical protein